jgi:hypothetical protein
MSKELSTMSKKLDQRSILSFLVQHGYDHIVDQLKTPKNDHSPRFYIELINGLLEHPEFAHLPVIASEKIRWLHLKEVATRCATFTILGEENGQQAQRIRQQRQERTSSRDYHTPGLRAGWELADLPEGSADWEVVAYRGWYEYGFARGWNNVAATNEPQDHTVVEIDPVYLEKLNEVLEEDLQA